MIIEKNEKTYRVNECKNYWALKYENGGLSVTYQVDKELCKTEAELSEYVKGNDMF